MNALYLDEFTRPDDTPLSVLDYPRYRSEHADNHRWSHQGGRLHYTTPVGTQALNGWRAENAGLITDGELSVDIAALSDPAGWEMAPVLYFRAQGTASYLNYYPRVCLALEWYNAATATTGTLRLRRVTSSTASWLASNTAVPRISSGATYRLKARFVGTRVLGKVWDLAGPEPDWAFDYTAADGTVQLDGNIGLGNSVRVPIAYDDFTLTDLTSPGSGPSGPQHRLLGFTGTNWAQARRRDGTGWVPATGTGYAWTGTGWEPVA